MEDKNIYLVVYTETEFYDPHGTADDGGSTKSLDIIKDGDWEKDGQYISYENEDDEEGKPFEPGVEYNGEGISRENDDTEYYGQDGYNCEVTWTSIKIITKEEYDEYSKIIESYNKI
jgi:hypothetical protein